MGHNHSHNHHHSHASTGNIRIAFLLNLFFTIFEIFGGLWTNSMAIFADAVHDLGDSLSLGMAWYLEKISHKGRDQKYSFGYRRFSLLGALLSAVILITGSLFVLAEAVPRIFAPEKTHNQGMILFAIFGILVNLMAAMRLKKDSSMNARMIMLHLLEDGLGWAGVLIVGTTLTITPMYILDPILSVLITCYILFNVVKGLKKTLAIFLQATPDNVNPQEVESRIKAIDGVNSIHHSHIWSMDGEHHAFTTHLVVAPQTSKNDIITVKAKVKDLLKSLHFKHYTIEIEYEGEDCKAS